ncbi:MAG: TrbC/VirB2 family protein [Candidatus Altiarchaeota archaeon]
MKTKHNFFGFKLDKKYLSISVLLLLSVLITTVYAQALDIKSTLCVLICRVFNLIFFISTGIAALIIIAAGIKWIGSGDDPSARGAAKSTIVHAIIGLIVVIIAVFLVWWIAGSLTGVDILNPTGFITGDCAGACGAPT